MVREAYLNRPDPGDDARAFTRELMILIVDLVDTECIKKACSLSVEASRVQLKGELIEGCEIGKEASHNDHPGAKASIWRRRECSGAAFHALLNPLLPVG